MKKILIFTLLFVVFLFEACKKEAEQGIESVVINTTVSLNAEFRFELKQYIHDGEFPVITRPPVTYQVSRIVYTDRTAGPVYQYISNTTGTDRVIIKIVREHEHNTALPDDHQANDDYTSVIITINFTVQ